MLKVNSVKIEHIFHEKPWRVPPGIQLAYADLAFANEIRKPSVFRVKCFRVIATEAGREQQIVEPQQNSRSIASAESRLQEEIAHAIFTSFDATRQTARANRTSIFRCFAPDFSPCNSPLTPHDKGACATVTDARITLATADEAERHKGKFLGLASCTIGGELRIENIRLLRDDRRDRFVAAMPDTIVNGMSIELAAPLTEMMRRNIEQCLLPAYVSATTTSTSASPES